MPWCACVPLSVYITVEALNFNNLNFMYVRAYPYCRIYRMLYNIEFKFKSYNTVYGSCYGIYGCYTCNYNSLKVLLYLYIVQHVVYFYIPFSGQETRVSNYAGTYGTHTQFKLIIYIYILIYILYILIHCMCTCVVHVTVHLSESCPLGVCA